MPLLVRRLRLLLPAVLVGLLAAGCRLQTEVTVQMDDDGSGTVEVAVGLDEAALAELPDLDRSGVGDAADLAQLVRSEDLTAAGWTVGAPEADGDVTWLRASKRFGTPDEAAQILTELTGAEGGLRDFRLERSKGFGSTKYSFAGSADLSGGLEAFGDAGLAQALDGEPLGQDAAEIESRLGAPLSEMVTLAIAVEMPGTTETWTPTLGGDPVDMAASSTVYDPRVLLLTALAVLCVVALGVVLLIRWRRAA